MKTCYFCGKTSLVAGGYSNRIRATKFNPTGKVRKQPNLQWARLVSDSSRRARLADGRRTKICTRCLKSGKYISTKVK
ncbi:MAG: hypothetical protein HY481_00905 [Candidatus Vogelbacteria bacterium]|nr:hypothetical protein [Candidatus Vogelbacteria bacterium]